MRRFPLALLALLGCEGPMGPRGFPGAPAQSLDGGAPLDGGGEAPLDARADDATVAPSDAELSLRGVVRDPSGSPVRSGSVVLVPAVRVAALAATPIDLTSTIEAAALAGNDEPLEDLLASVLTLPRATVEADGSFRFVDIPDGEHFVVFTPAPGDAYHLPGGQLARVPQSAEALRSSALELRVSGAAGERARYVGSSSCVTCHARHTLFASAHSLSVRVPGRSAPHQDGAGALRIDEALSAFERGEVLAFSCASAQGALPCSVRSDVPEGAPNVALRVRLGRDLTLPSDAVGRYYVELRSGASPPARYPLALTLGGTRSLQQFVARVALPSGAIQHYVLPFAYQLAGDDTRADGRDFRWAPRDLADWLDPATGALRTPSIEGAFERECAGCHATGYSATFDAARGYRGKAVSDPAGIFDLDGDGRNEQLAVGCEACHGPGSEHLEQLPRGQRIVSPRLLTPERQNLVCGVCHSRHKGKHGELAPLDDARSMPRPGIARRTFLAQHVSSFDPGASFPSGDARVHFEQYGELLRSPKYRSPKLLVTCSDCHDPHRGSEHASDLREEPPSGGCPSCHAGQRDVRAHVASTLRFAHDVAVDGARLTCTNCHMVRTGLAGARIPALRDATDPDFARHETYYHGDRTSHRFVYTGRSLAAEQPVAATNGCAPCHGELLPAQ